MKQSLAAVRAAHRNPELRWLQLGYVGSAIGYWAAAVAVTVFAYRAGGAAAVALLVALRTVPAAVAAPLLATLADRHSRIAIMVSSNLVRLVALLGTAALMVAEAVPITVYLGAALAGVAGTAFEPAKQALLPELARTPEELTSANVVSSAIDSTSFFVGPAVAGLVLAVSSPQVALVFTAATLVWSALLVGRIPEPRREGAAHEAGRRDSFLRAARAGFTTVLTEPGVRLVIGIICAQVVVAGLEGTLIAALVLDTLDLGDSGLGFLNSALGVGGLLGAIGAIALVGRRRLATVLGVGCVLWGVPFALIGVLPTVAVTAVGLVVVGLANTLVDVSGFTLLQRIAPPEVLGRVFGIMESLFMLAMAVGAGLAPVLIALLGIEGALIAQGLFLPAVVVLCWAGLRRLDALADVDLAESAGRLAVLRRIPLFSPLPAPVIERLASVATSVHLPAGATVFSQGDPGDRFYVIGKGRVVVEIDGGFVREEGPGESFGEIALLRDTPRTATIRALEDLELLALERDEFVPAVTGYASSRDAADQVVSRRLVFARPAAAGA